MSLTYAEIMADEHGESDEISFKEIFQNFWKDLKIQRSQRKVEKTKPYPKDNNEAPVYREIKLMNREGEITATAYQLVCPVCQELVTRRQEYCSECGNKLKVEAEL